MFIVLGSQAANNFRNAAGEAANRSGYGNSASNDYSNRSSPSSSNWNTSSGQNTTEKLKEKASEFAEQARSSVRQCSMNFHEISASSFRPNQPARLHKTMRVKLRTKLVKVNRSNYHPRIDRLVFLQLVADDVASSAKSKFNSNLVKACLFVRDVF